MRIHVPSKTIHTTDKRAYSNGEFCYRVLSGGKAEPIADVVWNDFDIYEYTEPIVGENQKRTDVLVDNGTGGKTWQVVDKTQAELDAELYNERQLMSLTPRQFRRALLSYPGKLAQVETYISGLTEEDKIDWAHGNSVDRLYPLTLAMIAELGFTDEQADNFFRDNRDI